MTRLHRDPVDVRTVDGEPEQFLWRGRLHVVREVLARWTTSGGWWQGEALLALTTGDGSSATAAPLETASIPSSPKWAQRAWGEPAPDVGAALGPAGVDDREQEWWRVEAGTGMSSPGGVYDLCFSWTGGPSGGAPGSGGWSLARVLD